MKTILFLIPTLGGGGAEKVLVNLVNHLNRKKYHIEIITLFRDNKNLKFLRDDIRVTSVFRKQFKGNRIVFKFFSPRFLYNRIIKNRYDIVVSYLEGPGERIVSGCPYPDSKLVNWIHVERHTKAIAAVSYRNENEFEKCLGKFNCSVAVSETVKADTEKLVSTNQNIKTLYNTLDVKNIKTSSLRPSGINFDNHTINIFSVGRLTPQKGFDRLIKVCAQLINDGFKLNLYLLGSGELQNDLQQIARELEIDKFVHLLGFHANPYKYLKHADLFVCSSRSEGFSTAVSEALILGIPVVSTNCSGATELLGENNEFGIVINNSCDGVYEGVKKMISNPATLQYYREAAKKRGEKFSTMATVRAVENMFDSL